MLPAAGQRVAHGHAQLHRSLRCSRVADQVFFQGCQQLHADKYIRADAVFMRDHVVCVADDDVGVALQLHQHPVLPQHVLHLLVIFCCQSLLHVSAVQDLRHLVTVPGK